MLDKFGFTPEYLTDLQILNEKSGVIYPLMFFGLLVYYGGTYPLVKATFGALLSAVLLNRLFFNKRQPIPLNTSVIITGCSSGIGKLSTEKLASENITVFATVRKQSDADALNKIGNKHIIPIILDVNNQDSVKNGVTEIEKMLIERKLSLLSLINNAGFGQIGFLELIDNDKMKSQFDTNVFGLVSVTNSFLPLLRKYSPSIVSPSATKLKPKIVNVSSIMGQFTTPLAGAYAATKYAVEAINDSYRMELKNQGIEVVSLEPGLLSTSFKQSVDANSIKMDDFGDKIKNEPNVREYYTVAHQHFDKQNETQASAASSPLVAYNVLYDIILSSNPLPRYCAGKDAHIVNTLLAWVPQTFFDLLSASNFVQLTTLDGKKSQ
jgi:short-subunit dehydrogenase